MFNQLINGTASADLANEPIRPAARLSGWSGPVSGPSGGSPSAGIGLAMDGVDLMSRNRLLVLLLGCCSILSCEASAKKSVKATTEQPEIAVAADKGETCDASRAPDEWVRRVLTESKRVDAQTARLAVSSVATSEPRSLLRLDTVLLGAGDWPAKVLTSNGLKVRRQDAYMLVETDRRDGLKPALRDTLLPIHEAIERVRGNLLTQKVVGQRAVCGELERLITASPSTTSAGAEAGVLVDFSQGSVTPTGQALDLAIQGKGFFVVEYVENQQPRRLYTRDGRFKLGKDGVVVSRAVPSAKLIPEIVLPTDTGQVAVSAAGALLARTKAVELLGERGRIALAWFDHPERLTPARPGFFIRTPEAGGIIEGKPTEGIFGTLQQGSVEGSNVNVSDNWTRLCLLEDARQLVLAMVAETESASGSGSRTADARVPNQIPGAGRVASSPTVQVQLPELRFDASEPTLLMFLRLRGTDVWVGANGVELQRNPETAASLVQYLKFLRKRLDVVAENIANAPRQNCENGGSGAYRRKIVVLQDDGEAGVVEDASPLRVASETGPAEPRLVELSNVDPEEEMVEADAVSREYRAVRETLQEMGGDAVPALTELLRASPAELRLDAAVALGQIGCDARAAVPTLIEALGWDDWELRQAATSALDRIAPDSAVVVQAIVRTWALALRSTDPRKRYEAAATLGRFGGKAAGAIPLLVELLDDPTSGAARALGRMGEAASPAVPALTQALVHSKVHVRLQAADALGRIGPNARSSVPVLIAAMKDENAELRWRAAVAIGLIGSNDSGCIAALAELLKDEHAQVRDRVAEALGRLGTSSGEVQGLLEAAGRAERGRDRVWPSFALAIMAQKPASFVLSLGTILLTDERATRLAACEALMNLGPLAKPAVPILTELLAGRDKAVVAAAIDALGAIGPAAGAAVPRLSVALSDRDPFIRRRAAAALGRIGEAAASAAPALVSRLSDESEPVVVASAEALGRIGPKAAESREPLKKLQQHRNAAVRSVVAASLAEIGEEAAGTTYLSPAMQAGPQAVAGTANGVAEP
jgi:HEAT repeat protein/flagellar basal body rod protein FlgF